MRGRKPNPTSQRQQAKAAKRAHVDPADRDTRPKPANLADIRAIDAASQEFADRFGPLLSDRGILTDIDRAAFELLTWTHSIVTIAGRHLVNEGLLLKYPHGATRKSPYYAMFRDASKMFLALCGEFGMTPASRLRVKPELNANTDELEDLFFGPRRN
jgi:P27 family predicted phage terminase small subunit